MESQEKMVVDREGAQPVDGGRGEPDSRLELRILGTFEALVDGEPVKLIPQPERLLATLTLRAGEALSVDVLIESVWDDAAPASAPSTLRLYVSQLRRVLPPGRLVTERAGYRLLVEEGELDAERFEHLLADGRRALAGGNDRLADSVLARALALWRGDVLGELGGELFARAEALRLQELRLQCVEGRCEAGLRLGRHEELIADLDRLVAEHPLRERLRVQLMTALYRAGRQADALACYREGRAYLDTELGLEPGAELRDLERRILAQDPTLAAPSSGPATGRRVPAPSTRPIGRDRDLRTLRGLLLEPRTRLVSLVGPAGIGKTRLAIEAASELGEQLADGALLVDLAPLSDPAQVVPALGRALGVREGESASWSEAISAELAGCEILVVLDNFEHVVEAAAELVPIIDAAPRLTLLVTSRSVLRLSAERVVDVRPLDAAAARELFASRVTASGVEVDARSPLCSPRSVTGSTGSRSRSSSLPRGSGRGRRRSCSSFSTPASTRWLQVPGMRPSVIARCAPRSTGASVCSIPRRSICSAACRSSGTHSRRRPRRPSAVSERAAMRSTPWSRRASFSATRRVTFCSRSSASTGGTCHLRASRAMICMPRTSPGWRIAPSRS